MENPKINVEVVYATAEQQWVLPVSLPAESTILQAICASQILTHCPDIDLTRQKVGIFGLIKSLDSIVQHNDRIEIYRPILVDPMVQRRQRVAAKRKKIC